MNKYYDTEKKRVVFFGHAPDVHFWDAQWEYEGFVEHVRKRARANTRMRTVTRCFLPKSGDVRIMEGGCGDGHVVLSLSDAGYEVYGVDTAEETVRTLNTHFPTLRISKKDVRVTGFPDGYFDGYWSIGVIEHFYDGYDEVLDEMARIIAPGGYAFISFPFMSGVRRIKGRLGVYPKAETRDSSEHFYQYALPTKAVIGDMERRGFTYVGQYSQSRLKGLRDEVWPDSIFLRRVSEGKTFSYKVIRKMAEYIIPGFFSHSVLLVMKKHDI